MPFWMELPVRLLANDLSRTRFDTIKTSEYQYGSFHACCPPPFKLRQHVIEFMAQIRALHKKSFWINYCGFAA